ncbi:hypothetical protein [Noviherbaspirillum malthae]|uniref:hypothetical protein n=1 Tax=Noviherbaspirillum malthae TaxID=1260987 RepID=UPI001890A8CD
MNLQIKRNIVNALADCLGKVFEGAAETSKRDYMYVPDCPDAATVVARLDRWFDDYNESHQFKGLRLKPPREFSRAQLAAGYPNQ